VRGFYYEGVVRPLVRRMSHLSVSGLENLSGPGPYIIVANHTTHLDTPLILSALPQRIRRRLVVAAAMDEFFMSPWRAFKTVLQFNAIPIDRHKINRRSSQLALDLIEDRWNLLLYPEGGRSPDGNLQDFKGGAAYLAERTRIPVIPTYIHEAGYLRGPKYAKAPRFTEGPSQSRHPVSVHFGTPLIAGDDDSIRRFGSRIAEAVAELGRRVSGDPSYGITQRDDGY
jgi:1-acyl-sn-glycerol-3-phosphate acyltransferase